MGIGSFPSSRVAVGVLLASVALLAGCASASGNLDTRFGEAVRQARAVQTINPEASRNTDPVAGIDGEAAQRSITLYRNSFREPPATFNVLNIGGSSLGAGGGP